MDFKPFEPPPTEHHGLATGLSSEGGVSARGFVQGVNDYFEHLFKAVGAKKVDDSAPRIAKLEAALKESRTVVDELGSQLGKLTAEFEALQAKIVSLVSAASPKAPDTEQTS